MSFEPDLTWRLEADVFSGFEGPWVHNPTRFSNQYYRLLGSLTWKKKKLPNGVEQFMHYDEDTGTELMMLPTDMALQIDPAFAPWVKKYAEDKDAFYKDFSAAFAKLLELGIKRDSDGRITNADNEKGGYHAAPRKQQAPGKPQKTSDDHMEPSEADSLARENQSFKSKL